MKKLEVIIKPFQLDEVKDALASIDVDNIIVTDVRCSHNGEKNSESYLTDDYFVEFLPKIRVEIFVEDNIIGQIANIIRNTIDNDASSHSRIFIYDTVEV
jgi:nitrogen regulatory protein P-II 1